MKRTEETITDLDNLLSSGQYDELLEQTNLLLKDNPNDDILFLFKGNALRHKGMSAEALQAFAQSILCNPNNALARSSYASTLYETGDLANALNAADAGILIDPEFSDPYLVSGDVLMEMGFPEQAVFPYNKAYDIDGDENLGVLVATLYAQNNMPEEAMDVFSSLISKNPNNPVLHFRYGTALLYALQNGASHEMIKEAAKDWREKYHDKPFVEEFSQQLIDNHVAYNPLNAGSVATLFDTFAESYDGEVPFEPVVQALKANIGEQKDLTILDAGCGTGRYANVLKEFSSSLLGVDVSRKMLDKAAQKKAYTQLFQADFRDFLSENEGAFDVITALDVLDYTPRLSESFASLSSGLREGGMALLTLYRNNINTEGETIYPPFYEIYSEKFVKKAATDAGFTVKLWQEIPSESYKNSQVQKIFCVLKKES